MLRPVPCRVLANYMLWRAVRSSVSALNMDARDARLKFYAQVYGKTEHRPRWKDCLDDAISEYVRLELWQGFTGRDKNQGGARNVNGAAGGPGACREVL